MSTAQPSIQDLTFLESYLEHGNASRAARDAGYTGKNDPWRVLAKPAVKAYVAEYRSMAAERAGVNADMLMQHLAAIIGFDMARLYDDEGKLKPVHQLDDETRRAISEIEEKQFGRKTKAYDKLSAITLAMKHLGLLVDRVEHSGEVQVVGMAQRIRERAAKAAPDASPGLSGSIEEFA